MSSVVDLSKKRSIKRKGDTCSKLQSLADDQSIPQNTIDLHGNHTLDLNIKRQKDHLWNQTYYKNVTLGTIEDVYNLSANREKVTEETGIMISDEITLSDGFVVDINLKAGGFSKSINLCQDVRSKKKFIIKKIAMKTFNENEVIHLCKLRHENIPQFLGFFVAKDVCELFQEYCGWDLTKWMISRHAAVIERQLYSLLQQICYAVIHCDRNNILHLDIKPQNICLQYYSESGFHLKLTDWGSSKTTRSSFFANGYTKQYAAPELHYNACCEYLLYLPESDQKYGHVKNITSSFCKNYNIYSVTTRSDCFSIGLTCIYIMWRNNPVAILKQVYPELKDCANLTEYLPQLYSENPDLMIKLINFSWGKLSNILRKLLEGDPSLRWNATEVLAYLVQVSEQETSTGPYHVQPHQMSQRRTPYQRPPSMASHPVGVQENNSTNITNFYVSEDSTDNLPKFELLL